MACSISTAFNGQLLGGGRLGWRSWGWLWSPLRTAPRPPPGGSGLAQDLAGLGRHGPIVQRSADAKLVFEVWVEVADAEVGHAALRVGLEGVRVGNDVIACKAGPARVQRGGATSRRQRLACVDPAKWLGQRQF